jgi:hypothetical protein
MKKTRNRVKFRIGDFVEITRIPIDLSDGAKIGTPHVFKRALGGIFRVEGFDRYGHLELQVTKRDTIWIAAEFVVIAIRQ